VPTPRTRAEDVYNRLRADILAGRHAPGARLRYSELCAQYQTSMGGLRETMLRLAEQGLVKGEPQHGFQVVELSADDLRELTEARLELEAHTLRHAILDGDIEWESRLIAAHHRLSRTAELDPDDAERLSDHWVSAHAEFHRALLDGCANQRLKDIAGSLRDTAELYRRWSVPLAHGSDRDIAAEHVAILTATLERDADTAVRHLSAHIGHTTDILLVSMLGDPAPS
jgi:DNA-binding GntR family transcriptional regulator